VLDGFIVTQDGRYAGVGSAQDLIREMTELQIAAARYANPLTLLPGNVPIAEHVERLIAQGCRFVACYFDLDHFKPYNDVFGYQRGDEAIQLTARMLAEACDPKIDFVGHIGGDDFVFFVRSQDWPLRLVEMMRELSASLVNFHPSEHREAGGYSALGREGTARNFPLLSVSLAAVEVDASTGMTAETVTDMLRRTKSAAKARRGNSCILMAGDRLLNLMTHRELVAESAPGEGTGLQVQVLLSRS
jgi:diguanylate cyclase (GGDEF)-like protein